MLRVVGLKRTDELFTEVPEEGRVLGRLKLPEPLGELQLIRLVESLAARNRSAGAIQPFLGGGAYDHYVPAAVDQIVSRSEFYTAYTPYQPEISQGTLQAIYEYQTMACSLLDMDISNASMYDGASALAEAVWMVRRISRRRRVVLAGAIHPSYLRVVETYAEPFASDLMRVEPDPDTGTVSVESLRRACDEDTAAVVVQYPNFFGCVEDLDAISAFVHQHRILLVVAFTEPIAFGLLKPPGTFGADIVVGEGQALGLPVSYGGPYLGIFTAQGQYVRAMPGRLVGKTVDGNGEEGFVLTLSTREQHIRRERATSNICTNQGLCALTSAVYLSLMGPEGLKRVATVSHVLAEKLKSRIRQIDGVRVAFSAATFNEFVIKLPDRARNVIERAADKGILPGVDLGRFNPDWKEHMLITVTEKHTLADLEALADFLQKHV
jgi:glycine dehydrogenase subunit 1